MRSLLISLALVVVSACAPKGYTPYYANPAAPKPERNYDQISLERTACFGFCPIYKVVVNEDDVLSFRGERFVAETGGAISKRLPDGSFKDLLKVTRTYGFSELDTRYPNEAGDNCGPVATDMPSVIVEAETKSFNHQVQWYQGCMNFNGRERFEAMLTEMEAIFDIDDWIGAREDFMGGER
ncbi:DUF6438 domain-containing protein [Hyphococcus flavus]|uniref:DUF6438 domain-containing protein n=1 Tax=Hyphococcus flavus TaxID=1866326 RepID=A0AAE9ZAQ6_9PROT|nr:DUF6438 domain-containing protein [Hyphococcus flavus]WDI30331.1 DUF6438 domain-containing protein [Hyphococcus flavus]